MRHSLERAAKVVRFAAEPAPFRNGENKINAGLIRHDAGFDYIVPLAPPAFRRLADGEAAIAVRIEQAELESVRT